MSGLVARREELSNGPEMMQGRHRGVLGLPDDLLYSTGHDFV
jgi:hypothetical protein